MSTIRQWPITIRDSTDKVIGIIGAIRLLLAQSEREALIVGNAALSAALESLEVALVRAGSRFTMPVIFINIRSIMKDLGLEPSADDA
jgi:hypothetical protein